MKLPCQINQTITSIQLCLHLW